MKTKTNRLVFLPQVFGHIQRTWQEKKGSAEFPYPWTNADRKSIEHFCRIFTEFGVMALWDLFIARTDQWTKKSGYSIGYFTRQLPYLIDEPKWKDHAREYEEKLMGPVPKEVTALFDMSKVLKEKK